MDRLYSYIRLMFFRYSNLIKVIGNDTIWVDQGFADYCNNDGNLRELEEKIHDIIGLDRLVFSGYPDTIYEWHEPIKMYVCRGYSRPQHKD